MSPDTAATNTPTKAPGDGSKALPFQFGSISPGFMYGMQIPARTSSAPPDLDEQKLDQARHDSYRSVPPVPTPSVPKQQLPRKPKKDVQISLAPSSQSQKPMTGISMPMPFHQPPVSVQFGVPNQQFQSQMPLPMQLPMGSGPQVQQQVFVPGLQPHPMPPQGIMHQGQSLGFTSQMGPQLPPQVDNLGMGMPPQFHPIPSFTPSHPINYHTNSYNASSLYFSTPNPDAAGVPVPLSGPKDKPLIQLNRSKSTASSGKKKQKEILQKEDAAGTTSDLYMAYKGPEEKKEVLISSESTDINSKHLAADAPEEDHVVLSEKDAEGKVEADDCEDAADISKPKLETSDNGEQQVHGGKVHDDIDGTGNVAKMYSSDFLVKFADQFIDFLEGLKITPAQAQASGSLNATSKHVGGNVENVGGRVSTENTDAAGVPVPLSGSKDKPLNELKLSKSSARKGKKKRKEILLQSVSSQRMQRNSPDADRWLRATNFQKGLIPSPQTPPLQKMHKAEKKYRVGKIIYEEQAKQRQLRAILNKLTPQNFEKLFEQVKAVNIDNAVTLTGFIIQIFDKALTEPTFCEVYANFCYHLAGELPDFSEDNEKITFKRLLLNKCQEEFERGEREQEEANKADEEGEIKQSEEEREEKRIKARRRMLGNIRLLGELYKKKMLTERIMHECIKIFLGNYQNFDEEDVEALCKLMSTIGEMIDHPKAKEHMDAYFDRMKSLSNNMKLSSKVRFMLKDSIDLRNNKWQQRRKVENNITGDFIIDI